MFTPSRLLVNHHQPEIIFNLKPDGSHENSHQHDFDKLNKNISHRGFFTKVYKDNYLFIKTII